MRPDLLTAGLAAFAAALPPIAAAQDTTPPVPADVAAADAAGPDGAVRVVRPEDLARFTPRTALDLIENIPGFQFSAGDTGSRGLGQASSNVLINGERVAGKSNSARDALARLPVGTVQRIEIKDASAFGVPGLTGEVANVIASVDGFSGAFEWQTRFRESLKPAWLGGEIAMSGQVAGFDWTASLENRPRRNGNNGPERITGPGGELIETRFEDADFLTDRPALSLGLGRRGADLEWSVNGRYELAYFYRKETSLAVPVAGQEILRINTRDEDEYNYELGGEAAFSLGPGRLKLIALERFERSPVVSTFREGELGGASVFESVFDRTIDEGETIGRAEWNVAGRPGYDWQVAAEGAFNTLQSDSALFEGIDGQLESVFLPGASATVEELRAEASLTHSRPLSPTLALQLSAGAEWSELSQSGPGRENTEPRAFTRPKGYAALTWSPTDRHALTLRAERRVAQLNFFDFISSVDFQNDNADLGNAEIVPPQFWEIGVEFNHDLGRFGAYTAEVSAFFIEDVIAQVPIGSGEGPGNIDTAETYTAEFEGELNLDPFGLPGVRLQGDLFIATSSIQDPVTGLTRRRDGMTVHSYDAEIRWDVPGTDFAFEAYLERSKEGPEFRLDEIQLEAQGTAFVGVRAEHKDFFGMTATIDIGNLADQEDEFIRRFFTPDRNGVLVRTEDRARRFGPIYVFELTGTF